MGLTCDLKETVNSRNKECGLYPDYNNIVFVINFSTDYIIKITLSWERILQSFEGVLVW